MPANSCSPGRSGTDGRLSMPTALISARTLTSSVAPSARRRCRFQCALASSQRADTTSVPRRTFLRSSCFSAISSMYAFNSSRRAKKLDQSGLGSNEYE